MKIAIIGRTRALLETAKILYKKGYEIPLIITCKAEPFYKCNESEFEAFACEVGAKFYNTININKKELVEEVANLKCDIAVSINWMTILKEPICNAFKFGIFNAHCGDLPKYRGNACPNWAIINGEKKIGLSFHVVLPNELDAGDIAFKKYFKLKKNTYISEVYDWCNQTMVDGFVELIALYDKGKIKLKPQSKNPRHILRVYPRKPEDSKINFDNNADDILKCIRASSHPFSGAYCFLNGRKIIVWRAKIEKHHGNFNAICGQVLYKVGSLPAVACNDKKNILILEESIFEDTGEDANKDILSSLRNRLS